MEKFKVMISAQLNDKNAIFNIDCIYIDGSPHAVVEWKQVTDDGIEVPAITVPLDPKYLDPLTAEWGEVRFLYSQFLDLDQAKQIALSKFLGSSNRN